MPDTLTPAPSGAPAAPATPVAPQSIADAGAAFKAAASWEDLNLPSMAVTDGDDDPPVVAPADGKPAESIPSPDEGPEFVQNAQGQWHRPDGTFANADEITAIEAQIAAETPKPADAPVVDPAANMITLRRRDGTTRDVQVDDPELAEEIRTNFNDGMRRKEYTEKVAATEAKLAQLNRIDALLEKSPETFVAQSLNPEQKVRLATMLLAEHFEALVPIIQGYDADPAKRIAETAESARRMREQEADLTSYTQAQQSAAAVRTAVAALIPDTLDAAVAESLWADASTDLQRAIARGEKVDPSTVPALLAARLKLYGIAAGAAAPANVLRITASPSNAPASSPAVAQPANDAAKALAAATATQKRIRLQQTNRRNAAAVPPAGAGAAPVRLPPVPANASIEDAARAMKKQRSWTS
jgi:hypothetical protein